jgi:hypothetical protein
MQVSDLLYPEQLVIWAARRWLNGKEGWDRVQEEFALSLGCARARLALRGLEGLLQMLCRNARRTVYLHRLDCPRVSEDEQALLTLLAAVQTRRPGQALAVLDRFFSGDDEGAARPLVDLLAAALADAGRPLPSRPPPVSVSLH